jgi:hypothetical protein
VTVLTTIRAITEKVDVIDATNATNVINAIDLINAANVKKKFAENAVEVIAKRYAMYLYVILVNQTTKKKETINVYS